MKTISISEMKLDRITKGAVLYKAIETAPNRSITNLYLRKVGLEEPYPTTIHVRIQME